jgi:hypothetical protein
VSKKRKKIPIVVLREFIIVGCNGVEKTIRVTGHKRNQAHKRDGEMPAQGSRVPVCVCGECKSGGDKS